MSAPLLSISLGCSAIFLLGKETKAEKPVALMLRSGDVVIMSSKARMAYHAVPKILSDPNLHKYFEIEKEHPTEDLTEWTDFFDYIRFNRININIRQVN